MTRMSTVLAGLLLIAAGCSRDATPATRPATGGDGGKATSGSTGTGGTNAPPGAGTNAPTGGGTSGTSTGGGNK
jgi:hypothetical protein